MSFKAQQTKLAIIWILPTALEVFVYTFIAVMTFALSNLSVFKKSLFLPSHFSPYHDVINSISGLVERVFGERIAGSLSLGIFWGLVGMVVYVLIWLLQNFSTELSNDLAMTKYVVPRGGDPESPLRDFISTTVFRVLTVILLIFYTSLVFKVLLPRQLSAYQGLLLNWPDSHYFIKAFIAIIGQMLTLHGFVVFARLILLRKRIFG